LARYIVATLSHGANPSVAGVISPLVMHSALALALTSMGLMSIGLVSWIVVNRVARRGRSASLTIE
jgi:DHA1 family bicyclomycin/chloramphenicol resistance-like MFS transporter